MKSATGIAAIAGLLRLISAIPHELSPRGGCGAGDYAVKIENHGPGCTNPHPPASIANYASDGGCTYIVPGQNFMKAINADGCSTSGIDLHCYATELDCTLDPSGSAAPFTTLSPGSCTVAPENCPYYRAVAGPSPPPATGNCVFETTSDSGIVIPGPAGGTGPNVQNGFTATKNGAALTVTSGDCDGDCNVGTSISFQFAGLPEPFVYKGMGDEAGCPSDCRGSYGSQTSLVGKASHNALSTSCSCTVKWNC